MRVNGSAEAHRLDRPQQDQAQGRPQPAVAPQRPSDLDGLVAGAGFSGLYLLHRLRTLGFSARAVEAAADVVGTWYGNRYPGARCDIPTTDHCVGFDPELARAWSGSEKHAAQPKILRYAQCVAERYGLRPDIDFNTRADAAQRDARAERWQVRSHTGPQFSCRCLVMASGCLSLPKAPEISGAERLRGEVCFTSRWPHDGVDFTGKGVAVIGTGSSGVQAIPLIASQTSALTVFQRMPNLSIPAGHGPVSPEWRAALDADRAAYRVAATVSRAGVPRVPTRVMGRFCTPELQRARFEAAWQTGELIPSTTVFADQILFTEANAIVAGTLREKIPAVVTDPQTARLRCPSDHAFGTQRPCLDTGYCASFNQPHVRLVDLRSRPIQCTTETGIKLAGGADEWPDQGADEGPAGRWTSTPSSTPPASTR